MIPQRFHAPRCSAHRDGARACAVPHRDLKPGNLFLVPDAEALGGERVKLLDFGIAKFFNSSEGAGESGDEQRHLTTVGKMLGTPVYMSPEQCSGAAQIDERIDVYALGVILYQMLAGRLPFEAAAACVVMTKHIMEQPPNLQELHPELSPDTCALVHDMLVKDPKVRPSMPDVTQRLDKLLSDEFVMSSHDFRSVKLVRRRARKQSLTAVAVGALFLISTVGLLGIGKYRRTQAAKRAEEATRAIQKAKDDSKNALIAANAASTATLATPGATPDKPAATPPAPHEAGAATTTPDDKQATKGKKPSAPKVRKRPEGGAKPEGSPKSGGDGGMTIPVFR